MRTARAATITVTTMRTQLKPCIEVPTLYQPIFQLTQRVLQLCSHRLPLIKRLHQL